MSEFPYEFDSDQNFFCRYGIELTQSDVLADLNTMERQLAEANAALAAYRKAWELPNQPITQGVVPSAGEVAANAVEEAKIYREQRDAANAALAEAVKQDKLHEESMMHHYHLWLKTDDALIKANAALAEAVKGLERIAAPESDAGMMAARDTLARIEALKVQPEVAQ